MGGVKAARDMRGQSIGRYEILDTLGQGGMGVVYEARDPHLDRVVAIKTPRADLGLAPEQDAQFRKRFYREAMAAGRLNHPHIVAIHDVLEIDDASYIVMEYVEGQTLAEVIAGQAPLSPPLVVAMAGQVLSALECAHTQGVVHRDIKPGNILVDRDGAIKVGDFGIARVEGTGVTQTAGALGSPAYIAPEQVRGREADGRADLFSVAVVLYEALSGHRPFTGENFTEVLYQIAHAEPRPLRERNRSVPPALETVIHRALAKEPEERYPDARAFADALRAAVGAAPDSVTVGAHGTLPLGRAPRWRPRWIGIVGAGHLVAALMIATALWVMWAAHGRRPVQVSPPGEGQMRGSERPSAGTPRADPAPEAKSTNPRKAATQGANAASRSHNAVSRKRDDRLPDPTAAGAPLGGGRAAEPGDATRAASSVPGPGHPGDAQTGAGNLPAFPTPTKSDVTGCLSVNALPFASVFVDGRRVGETPKACVRVPAGERRVYFEANAERSPQRIVRVTGDHTAENPLSISYDFRAKRFLDQ